MKVTRMINKDVYEFSDGQVVSFIPTAKISKGHRRMGKYGTYNDGDFIAMIPMNNKYYTHPIYNHWKDMCTRVLNTKLKRPMPTYKDVTIVPEWKLYSNFESWVLKQPAFIGLQLDKDVLKSPDTHIYGPDTCVFIPDYINKLLQSNKVNRFPIGASLSSEGRMVGVCGDGEGHRLRKHIGKYHEGAEDYDQQITLAAFCAHRFWQRHKIIVITKQIKRYMQNEISDDRVVKAMQRIIKKIQSDMDHGRETTINQFQII